ncbi:hypothetical protein, partial [Klebsiella pneumoniae]|uniref:hypothetical protein n=1 Tax=Klebsiella pneumoniae TaxID=573 RepID=UPI002730F99F
IAHLEKVVAEQKEQIETLQQFKAPELPQLSAGITFPYSTEGLEALRSVALKHWAGYTPDKRQPTQKEIGYAICEELEIAYQKTNE